MCGNNYKVNGILVLCVFVVFEYVVFHDFLFPSICSLHIGMLLQHSKHPLKIADFFFSHFSPCHPHLFRLSFSLSANQHPRMVYLSNTKAYDFAEIGNFVVENCNLLENRSASNEMRRFSY